MLPQHPLDLPASLVLRLESAVLPPCSVLELNRQMATHLLEYHQVTSRMHYTTTTCVRVEQARLRVAPEAPKSCLAISTVRGSRTGLLSAYVCCSIATLMIELAGIKVTMSMRGGCTFRA